MHEMSIASSIVDIALRTLADHEGTKVKAVQLRLGVMSGVEREALLFCFDAVTQGTPAEGAVLQIETVPVSGRCLDCDEAFEVMQYTFRCPACESALIHQETGRELLVTSIDME